MIELENVTMTYPGGMTALKNVNINIEKASLSLSLEAVDLVKRH